MSVTADEYKKQQRESKGSGIHLSSALIFIIFGFLMILKLINYDFAPLSYIPDFLLYWIAAIGSTFGGIYMIWKKYIYRKRVVYKG